MEQLSCLKYLRYKIFYSLILVLSFYGCGSKDVAKEEAADHEAEKSPEVVYVTDPDKVLEGPIISFPQQIINIKGGGLLFLTLGVQFGELSKPDSENVLVVRYMDAVIQVASEYSGAELSVESGKTRFKEELMAKLNEVSDSDATISHIYFQNILVR